MTSSEQTAIFSRIAGTGGYLPERVLTNAEIEKMVDTTDDWITSRTGIKQRHIAAEDEFTLDLAENASRQAIANAGIDTSQIDLIVVATTTPDRVFPSTACLLQSRLDVHGCPAFDVQAVCTGFVYAFDVADKFIRTGTSKCALVVGAETFSRIINWKDRNTCVLFGDGAGAVVLQAHDEPGVYSTHLHADGDYANLLHVPSGVSNNLAAVQEGRAYVEMAGSEVFKMAVNTLGRIVDETLDANNMTREDVDWLVPHQANSRIINATARKLRLSMDKVILTVQDQGNTSAASIPLALHEGVTDGRIKRGETLMIEGFGGGFTWGSALLRY